MPRRYIETAKVERHIQVAKIELLRKIDKKLERLVGMAETLWSVGKIFLWLYGFITIYDWLRPYFPWH
jgi:hypothetical protein